MFLLNSCLGHFSAACSRRHPFSRSYGVILPSSLTMLLPSALGFSPHPPVSVYGTGTWYTIAAFLGSVDLRSSLLKISLHITFHVSFRGFPQKHHFTLVPVFPFPAPVILLRPHSSDTMWYRNLNLLSIGYASRPRLRPRLTQGRSALPWNPWIFGRKDSHLALATHSGILSSCISTALFSTASSLHQCSPTTHTYVRVRGFGVVF